MKDGHAAPAAQDAVEAAIDLENSFLRPRGRGPGIKLHKPFPRQRIGCLTKILKHRHGGVCDTDDAETYFDLVAPFLVCAAAIEKGDPVAYVAGWCKTNIPAFAQGIGLAGIEARVNAMVRLMEHARRTGAKWTPDMPAIVSALQLTQEENRAIGLRGFGSINRPTAEDVKARKKEHARKVRLDKGMVPQSQRHRTRNDIALAECIGRSLRTIKRWRASGRLDEEVRLMIQSGSLDGTKVCLSSLQGEHGGHRFVPPVPATNDNVRMKRTA